MRPHRCWLLFIALVTVGAEARAQADDGAQAVAIRAARLLDVRAGRYIENPIVVVRGERIESVTSKGQPPAGARVIELGDATLLPGLIDAHSHLLKNNEPRFFDGTNLVRDVTIENTATRVLRGAAMARQDLEAGITTVRDAGNSGINGDVTLRDAIENGYVPGPRIVACTRALSPVGKPLRR